ncbi:MAG: hypothetical protein MZV64_09590 [Ignavibacteriales bacterium]|nr:hypothetical protein [Ignavibacteriales bacterium]
MNSATGAGGLWATGTYLCETLGFFYGHSSSSAAGRHAQRSCSTPSWPSGSA